MYKYITVGGVPSITKSMQVYVLQDVAVRPSGITSNTWRARFEL